MVQRLLPRAWRRIALASAAAVVVGPAMLISGPIDAAYASSAVYTPGDLLVSTSVWTQTPNLIAGTTQLPPNCSTASGAADPCVTAVANGTYPFVFNNDQVDGSFGVTQPIVLDEVDPTTGSVVTSQTVPNSTTPSTGDQLVTSFSSKSEIALNQSTGGNLVTFMGYVAPVGAIDVSNSNTPGVVDSTNSAGPDADYRAVATTDQNGAYQFTETNAYSGNNGRAAVLNEANDSLYTVGNAGNGSNPEPAGIVSGAGSQILAESNVAESAQTPSSPTPLANFNANTELGITTDTKEAKDNNYRGLTVNGNVMYFTKGSGSNGVDTVYYLDTVGGTCPAGSGLPSSTATLPSASTWTSPAFNASTDDLQPTNACVLKGFPTASAKTAGNTSDYPFGVWFANPTTLYVADEGNGSNTYSTTSDTYTTAGADPNAGLQKWSLVGGTWTLDYVLQTGLSLGAPYTVAPDSASDTYPTGPNTYTTSSGTTTVGANWAPANGGLRNLTGHVNSDGTVTIWAATSTVSGSGDPGADPNALVKVTDTLADTSSAQVTGESFSTVMAPTYGQVIRGVNFTPQGSLPGPPPETPETPWAPLLPLLAVALGGAFLWDRSRRRRNTLSI